MLEPGKVEREKTPADESRDEALRTWRRKDGHGNDRQEAPMGVDGFRVKWYEHGGNAAWSRDQLDAAWTAAEVQLLSWHYPEHGPDWDGWPLVLPRRSRGAVRSKASKLRLSSVDRWTPAEEAAMASCYPAHGALWDGWPSRLPGRTVSQIRGKAKAMGLTVDEPGGHGSPPWTAEEDGFLIANGRHGKGWPGWAEGLPGRTWAAVKLRAMRLGVPLGRGGHGSRRWTEEEDRRLSALLAGAALSLGRTEEAVAHRMRRIAEKRQERK